MNIQIGPEPIVMFRYQGEGIEKISRFSTKLFGISGISFKHTCQLAWFEEVFILLLISFPNHPHPTLLEMVLCIEAHQQSTMIILRRHENLL